MKSGIAHSAKSIASKNSQTAFPFKDIVPVVTHYLENKSVSASVSVRKDPKTLNSLQMLIFMVPGCRFHHEKYIEKAVELYLNFEL